MSYINNIITGSLSTTENTRGIIGYNFSGSMSFKGADRQSKVTRPTRDLRISSMRNVRLTCNNERFYDTVLPDPVDITIANGSTFVSGNLNGATNQKIAYIVLSLSGNLAPKPDAGSGIKDTIPFDTQWPYSFPFEPRYSELKRKLNIAADVYTTKRIEWLASNSPRSVTARPGLGPVSLMYHVPISGANPNVINERYYALCDYPSAVAIGTWDATTTANAPIKHDFLKHYFGIGDNTVFPQGQAATNGNLIAGNLIYTKFPKFNQTAKFSSCQAHAGVGVQMRGWKYGVMNAVPYNSSAVFRRDRYGQFRDMLEQRQDGKFFGFVNESRQGSETVLDSAIICRFVNSDNLSVDPTITDSCNLSSEATSSLPFFDDTSRNRGERDATLIDSDYFSV